MPLNFYTEKCLFVECPYLNSNIKYTKVIINKIQPESVNIPHRHNAIMYVQRNYLYLL